MDPGPVARVLALLALASLPAACGGGEQTTAADEVTLYTCVTDTTIQPVIDAFEEAHAGTDVNLFRAPTGELNARVAADVRSGGLRADVIWACDPLTMQDYVDQGLVGGWTPDEAAAIPARFRTDDYVGAAILYLVAIHHADVPAPAAWSDLTDPVYAGGVAVPDPGFAASALGAVGYFAQADGYGLDFYADLEASGAVQVSSPDEVTVGVAQGVYDAGMTIANSAYAAEEDGSPVGVVWPEPGAVAIYGPVALARHSAESTAAKDFVSYVVSNRGQAVVGRAGSYPALPSAPTPTLPPGVPIVHPDWPAIAVQQDQLLRDYQRIFGS
ncbi:MAG: extracellular solute-binding protein [Actinomycetota bacterium]|nr:extracellular solute-binding protein [Actinomycetota bacterium]